MGSLTRDTIVSEALQLAGNTGLTSRANVWLQAFLDQVYSSHRWPFLRSRYGPTNITAGTTSVTAGGSGGTITTDALNGIWRLRIADSVNNGMKRDLNIEDADSIHPEDDPAWVDTTSRSVPTVALVAPSATVNNQWVISFKPVPDKTYRLLTVAGLRPAAIGGPTTPFYPNDETLIQSVYVQALRHQNDERFAAEWDVLRTMIAADRVKFGRRPGAGRAWQLAPRVFGRRRVIDEDPWEA